MWSYSVGGFPANGSHCTGCCSGIGGHRVQAVYEAGYFGFWLYDRLVEYVSPGFSMNSQTPERRYELDWLRVSAILVVFLYHSTRFFNLGDWHVKNVDTFVWVEMWNLFATRWLMPLFFIISGASLFYAIKKFKGFRGFYVRKFQRLMIPVLVASVTHSALQVYLERVTHGKFSGSFLAFLPEYFQGVYLAIGMPGNFAYHGMHLWYLFFLFLYSLFCYRLFVWLKGPGSDLLARTTAFFAAPGVMYVLFPIPFLIMKAVIPQPILAAGSGGWGFLFYLWFLMTGFMMVSSDKLQNRIKSQRWISLCLGVVLLTAYLYQLFSPSRGLLMDWNHEWVNYGLSVFSAWCWLFAIFGFGMKHLTFDRPFLRYANEGVLPFFILQQPVLLIVGYFVMDWNIHAFAKWCITFSISFIIVIALYVLIVRRVDVFRFLFGMKMDHPFLDVFQKRKTLMGLHVLYFGLIAFAVFNQVTGKGGTLSPMPLVYDPAQDVLLTSESITDRSPTGVQVVRDEEASIGKAVEFTSGANQRVEPQPDVYIEMRFSAPAGRYYVWLRGKTDMDNGYTDSVWLQVDDQIGTRIRSVRLGNWLDVHPAGVYGWAGDTDDPVSVVLKHTGEHTIRIQPRQVPHRIDQIWLSRSQNRMPNTTRPIR
jgi:glucan biosynthesis protein C